MSNLQTRPEQSQERPGFFRTTSQLSTRSSKSLSISRTFSSRKDKLRLYLALFPKGGARGETCVSQLSCDSYHWALVIGPKTPLRTEAGVAYHLVHNTSDFFDTPCFYEETDLGDSPQQSRHLLARVAIAKVLDEQRLQVLLRSFAAKVDSRRTLIDCDHTGLSCLSWVKQAWELLSTDSHRPLKSYLGPDDWINIEARTRKYVKRKRMQGRYNPATEPGDVTWNPAEVPTWNYWENRETTD